MWVLCRYNVAVTGRELLQAQGRARKQGGEYLTILDPTTMDIRMDRRSRVQAQNQGHAMGELVRSGAAVEVRARGQAQSGE